MKRAEALAIIDQEMGGGTASYNEPWLRVWERLGMVKFDAAPLSELEALSVAISTAQDSGALTAARVSGFLNVHGYEIKRK